MKNLNKSLFRTWLLFFIISQLYVFFEIKQDDTERKNHTVSVECLEQQRQNKVISYQESQDITKQKQKFPQNSYNHEISELENQSMDNFQNRETLLRKTCPLLYGIEPVKDVPVFDLIIPESIRIILISFLAVIVFFYLPLYVFGMLETYYRFKRNNNEPLLLGENTKISLYILFGYIIWALYPLDYVINCIGGGCSATVQFMVIPQSIMLFTQLLFSSHGIGIIALPFFILGLFGVYSISFWSISRKIDQNSSN
jgi:hypothetical protein